MIKKTNKLKTAFGVKKILKFVFFSIPLLNHNQQIFWTCNSFDMI